MKKEILLGNEVFPYTLTYKKVKNLNLRIYRDGSVCVSAPKQVSERQIEKFLLHHEERILTTLHRFASMPQASASEWHCGEDEKCTVLGMKCTIRVEKGTKNEVIPTERGLVVSVKNPADEKLRKKTFQAYLTALCTQTVLNLCRSWEKTFLHHKIPTATIKFRKMRSRWGSCMPTRKVITFSTALVALPTDCIEYVVCHEFTHFLHADHSPEFYRALSRLLPDWKERKDRIKELGMHSEYFS